jgi:hypothetical protein
MRALVLLTVLLAGCAASPSPTAVPSTGPATTAPSAAATTLSASPPPSEPPASPTPTAPTPTATPAPIVVAKGSLARVLVDKVVTFQKPLTQADHEPNPDLLNTGDLLFVFAGPVTSAGRQWYETVETPYGDQYVWVATTAADGTAQLGSGTSMCPVVPVTFAQFSTIPGLVALACFGDRQLTFPARLAAHKVVCGVQPGWTTYPAWLGPCEPHDYVEPPTGNAPSFDFVYPPSLDTGKLHYGINVSRWLKVRITGQYDYPAARTCHSVKYDTAPPPPAEVILACRSIFVITRVEPLS